MLEAIVPHPINPTDSWFRQGKVVVVSWLLSPDDIRVVEDGRCVDDRREGKPAGVAALEKDSANQPQE